MSNRKYQFVDKHGRVSKRHKRKHMGWMTVPAWFRRAANRKLRARIAQQMRMDNYENLPRGFNDAGWNYW